MQLLEVRRGIPDRERTHGQGRRLRDRDAWLLARDTAYAAVFIAALAFCKFCCVTCGPVSP